MKIKAIHIYVGIVCGSAVAILPLLDWQSLYGLPVRSLYGFLALAALGLISESLAVAGPRGRSGGSYTITFLPLLASALLFGPTAAVVFMGTVGAVAESVIRKKEPIRASFNTAQYVLSAAAAGWAFEAAGGFPLAGLGNSPEFSLQLGPFLVFGVVFLSLNKTAVSIAIALSQHVDFRKVWAEILGGAGTNILYDLIISPIALAVVFFYVELHVVGLLLGLLPILLIRHFYLESALLLQANRDLLKALIKAIETRDPYTSGHSLRVSSLATRIARAMGLPRRKVDEIETAALLHDIGKIDVVFSEILMKPHSLSDEERRVIESHVTKGAELLHSLSSFSVEIVAAVKHHHERFDGKGYPEGLAGEEIPIGARIIKACDAIDAMLSDRPYRKALQLSAVKEQLEIFSGTQFDPTVVGHVLGSSLLEDHSRELALDRTETQEVIPAITSPSRVTASA